MGSLTSKASKAVPKRQCPGELPRSFSSPSEILVLSRTGSMYFDEDGDFAHEFYVEVPSTKKGCKATMKQIFCNIHPQGEVLYKYPRLHVDYPVILYQI